MDEHAKPELMECEICFCLIQATRVNEHAYWHKIAASPMAHGMFLAARLEDWETANAADT